MARQQSARIQQQLRHGDVVHIGEKHYQLTPRYDMGWTSVDGDATRARFDAAWSPFDEATAILAADALQTLGFELLATMQAARELWTVGP